MMLEQPTTHNLKWNVDVNETFVIKICLVDMIQVEQTTSM